MRSISAIFRRRGDDMIRFIAGVVSALLLVAAGLFLWKSIAKADDPVRAPPAGSMLTAPTSPIVPPAAPDRTREEKRFDRYDKDRNDIMMREEYLAPRRKAWSKLDVNGDGKLSFEEWAIKTATKFAEADADHSGTLTRKEFATTRPAPKPKQQCVCAEPATANDD